MSLGHDVERELRDFHGRWTSGNQGSKEASKIVRELGSKKDEAARKALADGRVSATHMIHSNHKSQYSPQREQLHKAIVSHFMKGAGSHQKPTAIFTAGGAASGKSALAGRASDRARNLPTPKGHVYVNPDEIKKMLPEYKRLQEMGRQDIAASATHEESSHVAKLLAATAMQHKAHVVIDGVGNSGGTKFAGKIHTALNHGYNVNVRYAHLPVSEALKREQLRAAKSGRKVGESTLRSQHRAVSEAFKNNVRHIAGAHVQVFSTVGRGRPTLVAEKPRSAHVRVLQSNAYNDHLAKAAS